MLPRREAPDAMTPEHDAVGLCRRCVHARQVRSRTTLYWRCALAETDPRFERYPRLPVLTCDGFVAAPPTGGSQPSGPDEEPSGQT